jgi:hypothetical protein
VWQFPPNNKTWEDEMTVKGVAAGALIALLSAGTAQAQVACESLKGLTLPDVKITGAQSGASPAPHCKLDGVIGKETSFSVWLPDAWNGKFVMGGQGGFAGRVENQAMAMQALQKGYATAGTDTGHNALGADGSWALGEMERIVNYGHLGVHRATATAKAAVNAHYGRAPEKSYFAGCSNGGRQALMSIQRYPDDFDAVIAGAPALDFQRIASTFVSVTRLAYPDPKNLTAPVLNKPDREALAKAVLAKCDKADGLEDGVLQDPTACSFDLRAVACKSGNKDGCLSVPELTVVNAITGGPKQGGKTYYRGFPYGGEGFDAGWGLWLLGGKDMVMPGTPSLAYGFGVGFVRYFLKQDATWDYRTLDLAKLGPEMTLLQKTLSPNNPDLSAFRAKGGKVLMYHGWSDSALSPFMSLDYVDAVYGKDATARNDLRLFMLPGVLHCQGGPGPDRIDYLDTLDKWANGGAAPDELTAGFASGGARKVCAYPQKAVFKGEGDGKSPDQFECR